MGTKNKAVLTIAFVFGFGLIAIPNAQARNLRGVCKADIEKVCKDIKPGEGRISDCLKKNIKKISKDCKERVENPQKKNQNKKGKWTNNKKNKRSGNKNFKGKDESFLRGFERGFARGYERGFDRGQKNKVNNRSKNRQNRVITACKADIKKLCGDIKYGEGRIKACLEKNKKKLSEKCSTACEAAKTRGKRNDGNRGDGNRRNGNTRLPHFFR